MAGYNAPDIDRQLRRLPIPHDEDLAPLADSPVAGQLFSAIVSTPRLAQEPSAQRRPRGQRTSPRRRRRVLVPVTALAATVGGVAALVAGLSTTARPAAAAVLFTRQGPDIIATITNPEADTKTLHAEFARRGFDIDLHLLPVSPSLVGTVVYIGSDGSSPIDSLQGGSCVTGGGGCPIGVRIPGSFSGHADLSIGRPARGREEYSSTATAFGPGESLHCTGLLGAPVANAVPILAARGLTAEWRIEPPLAKTPAGSSPVSAAPDKRVAKPPVGLYIVGADPTDPGRVIITTSATPLGDGKPNIADLPSYEASLNRGC
jgi:hypothetical protein